MLTKQPVTRALLILSLAIQFVTTVAAQEAPASRLERVRVSDDGRSFVLAETKRPFIVWGVNYDHDETGRLLEDYWHDEWDTVVEDFGEIRSLGANVVRIHLQLGRFMETAERPNERNLARLGELVRLAERRQLYLDVTGLGCYHRQDVPAWYDLLPEPDRWETQARFWRAVAGVCRESNAIFCYDLMNEPVLAGAKGDTNWLAGEFAGKHFVQRITIDLAGRTREEVAKQWVAKLTHALRDMDDQHLITVGVIPWSLTFPGAKPLFYAPGVGDPLDFVSVHVYPKSGEVEKALGVLRSYEIGKPLVVEEIFPLSARSAEVHDFIERSRSHADGWISFYWGSTIAEYEAKGDLRSALVADWLKSFQASAP